MRLEHSLFVVELQWLSDEMLHGLADLYTNSAICRTPIMLVLKIVPQMIASCFDTLLVNTAIVLANDFGIHLRECVRLNVGWYHRNSKPKSEVISERIKITIHSKQWVNKLFYCFVLLVDLFSCCFGA